MYTKDDFVFPGALVRLVHVEQRIHEAAFCTVLSDVSISKPLQFAAPGLWWFVLLPNGVEAVAKVTYMRSMDDVQNGNVNEG